MPIKAQKDGFPVPGLQIQRKVEKVVQGLGLEGGTTWGMA